MLVIENIHDLEMALAASEQGSFSAAARVLGVTQPAVSQAVSRLERQLGVTLFDRQDSGRPGFLTDAGAVLLAHAITALDELQEALGDLAELEGNRAVCLGMPALLASAYFSQGLEAMAHTQQGHPIEIVLHDSERLYSELRLRHVDIGMIASADLNVALPHVTFTKVASYPLMLGMRVEDQVTGAALRLEKLARAQVPVIGFSGNLALRETIDAQLQRAGCPLNVVADTDQPEMLWRLVEAGMGVGLASGLAFEGAPDDIAAVPLADAETLRLHVFVFADTARLHGNDRKVLGALRHQLLDAVHAHAQREAGRLPDAPSR